MTHREHVHLIKQAITKQGGVWADLGSGEGAFTLALRDLAGLSVEIYSVDKDTQRLTEQKKEFAKHFPQTTIHFLKQDFMDELPLPPLDGVVMANSLHYVQRQTDFLQKLKQYLKPAGKLVLVEYNIDVRNPWIPYPLSFETFVKLMNITGFVKPKLLKKIPSIYWNEIYAAEATKSQ